jgi:Xaa-Pro aminopeptidase
VPSDAQIHREKRAQAQRLLAPGDLWLIATRENLEQPEPALSLISDAHLTWDAFFLLTCETCVAIVGRFDAASIPADWRVLSYDEDYDALLKSQVEALQPRRILLNFAPDNPLCDGLTHGMFLNLRRALPGLEFTSASSFLSSLRSVKTPAEQARIRAAVEAAEEDLQAMTGIIRDGISEAEIAAFLHGRIREAGLEPAWGWSGCPNVSFARMPAHAGPTDKKLEPGMLIHLDYGVKKDRYCSDLQRIYYWPRPGEGIPPELQHAFQTVWNAIEAAAQTLRPGARGYQVDAAARSVIVNAGYPEYKYATGHGLGRATHDGGTLLGPRWPRYGQTPEGLVQEGEVYTLELGVMVEGIGYVGLEEDVVVRAEGVEWLSRRQNEIYVLDQ